MPFYTFMNLNTKIKEEVLLNYSEYDDFMKDNLHLERIFGLSSPKVADPHRMGRKKADPRFREHLRGIKDYYQSTTMETD